MKKVFYALCSLFLSASISMAQTNPQPGFIITNTGDTVRGTIDFRTNEILSRKCVFWANGESEGKTYAPGDIFSFRFEHNGKYFVTRRLDLGDGPQLYFAEFLVQGLMNLYCVADTYDEHFFFEREDGEMARLTNRALITSSSIQDEKEHFQEKREQFGKVKVLLSDSWKAVEDMDAADLSRKRLVRAVRDYHDEVCTDGSSCMIYEYKEESDKFKTHLKAFAGYAYYSHERTVFQILDENYYGSAFDIGLGVVTDIERIMRGGSLELAVAYSPKARFEHDVMVSGGIEPSHTAYERSRVTISIGAGKTFGMGKIQPLVRGGGFYVLHYGNRETRYYLDKMIVDKTWGKTAHFGAYLGAGVQMAVGKHSARLVGDLYKSIDISGQGNMAKWSLTAEFVL